MASCLHRMLFALLTIATITSLAFGTTLHQRDDTAPAPISIAPDQNWDGINGKWSSFTIGVGTPPQYVRTFVSFGVYQTWVVLPQGCPGSEDACIEGRGMTYDNGSSSTWNHYLGIWDMWVRQNLGIYSNALFGFDKLTLGGFGEGGPTVDNTTIGAYADQSYYMGYLGINPKPSNFTGFDDPTPSLMTLLKQQRSIPSVSFGYTAGAHYRYTGKFASLTLGGYDTSLYDANDVTFIFAGDNERDVMVAIQSISTPSHQDSNPVATELLQEKIYALIDATVPELWLPVSVCTAFEMEFGLVYDDRTSLYLVNDTHHAVLLERNASITLQLAQGPDDNENVKITLPYAAFDLEASPPWQNVTNTTRYFPLRRANGTDQYTLGRTFLQEAYITVDYEVARFQVAQMHWTQTPQQHLVAIPPANESTDDSLWTSPGWNPGSTARANTGDSSSSTDSDSESSTLGAGAIAGIAVGAAAGVALIAGFIFFYLRRQKRRRAAAAATAATSAESKPTSSSGSTMSQNKGTTIFPKAELSGSSPYPFGMTHHDLDQKGLVPPETPNGTHNGTMTAYSPTSTGEGTYSSGNTLLSPASEADSKQLNIYEMPGDMPVVREKDGKQLSEKEALQHREKLYNGVDSNAVTPTTPSAAGATMGGAQDPDAASHPRRVNAEDIVDARTGAAVTGRHRAFSFEGERGTHDSQ